MLPWWFGVSSQSTLDFLLFEYLYIVIILCGIMTGFLLMEHCHGFNLEVRKSL